LFFKTSSSLFENWSLYLEQACKEHQTDPDFCVVARMEAFIAGWGLEEALRRAELCVTAGADAILVHSKRSDSADIEAFMRHWGNKVLKVFN